jgi:hypothetical protein
MALTHSRRTFMSVVTSLAGIAAVQTTGEAAAQTSPGGTDLGWLDALKGRHKQVYDYGAYDLSSDALPPLRFPRNYLNSVRDTYRLEPPDVNTAVGISAPAFPLNASDSLWKKYSLGERFKIIDPTTKQPAVRNIYLDGSEFSIKALQARGAVFWQCQYALDFWVQRFAESAGRPAAEVRTDLTGWLNPGVRIVPSHMLAIGVAQDHGFRYVRP